MNKIIYLAIVLTAAAFSASAQNVGIGTKDAKGALHVDAQKNTESNNIVTDDVIVTVDGDMGVGTITPAKKLDVAGNAIITGTDTIKGNATVDGIVSVDGSLKYGTSFTPPMAKLDIETSAPRTGFRLANGTEPARSPATTSPVLTADANGYAFWTNLSMMTTMTKGKLNDNMRVLNAKNANTAYYNITTTPLTLTEGTWLIIAKCTIGTIGSYTKNDPAKNGTKGFLVYMHLFDEKNNKLSMFGTLPESIGNCIGIPQLSYFYTVPPGQQKKISIQLSSSYTYYTTNAKCVTTSVLQKQFETKGGSPWTPSYFFAIKLDYKN